MVVCAGLGGQRDVGGGGFIQRGAQCACERPPDLRADVLGAKRSLYLGGCCRSGGFDDEADPGFVRSGVAGFDVGGVEDEVFLIRRWGGDLVETDGQQATSALGVVGGCF